MSVGTECEPYDLASHLPWSRELGITWNWVDKNEFSRWSGTAHPYIATIMDRFKAPFHRDFVLMIDADVIAIDRFDELFENQNELSGVLAHWSPFAQAHQSTWNRLFSEYGLSKTPFQYEHSGWRAMSNDENARKSPFYINTGVVFGSKGIYERLQQPYFEALEFVRGEMDSYFFEQIALTLAVERASIPVRALPLRFNFPNQPEFEIYNPVELADVRLLHFLRTPIVSRERDFVDFSSVSSLIAREDLAGSNEVLRRRLAKIPFSARDIFGTPIPDGTAAGIRHDILGRVVGIFEARDVFNVGANDEIRNGTGESHPDLVTCFDRLIYLSSASAYQAAIDDLTGYGSPLLVSGFDFAPMLPDPATYFHQPLSRSLEEKGYTAIPLGAYEESVVFIALPPAMGAAARDISTTTLRTAVQIVPEPSLLFEAVVSSRAKLGFFPDHLPRCIEYPWISSNLPQRPALRILDAGAGVSVLPFMLAERGHDVTTIDSHSLIRILETKATWNEWGYLDYGLIDPRIRSFNVPYQDTEDNLALDVVVSVSVIEHVPNSVRKAWIRKAYRQLVSGGALLLTVDTVPFSRQLWNFSEGKQVEDPGVHGTVDDLARDLSETGFVVDSVEHRDWLPLTKIGMARFKAHKPL